MPLTVELNEILWSKDQVKRLKALLEPGPFQFFKMEEDLQIAETERAELEDMLEKKSRGKSASLVKKLEARDAELEAENQELSSALKEAYFRLNEIAERLKEKKAALILEVLQDTKRRSDKKKKTLEEQCWSDSPPFRWSK